VINNRRMPSINPSTRRADLDRLLTLAHRHATTYLNTLEERPVTGNRTLEELRASLGGELPANGELPDAVLESIGHEGAAAAVASAGPRFFGFVIGGSLPVAVAADWLTSAWDQNSGLYVAAPAVSVMEETAARWLVTMYGLPPRASVGFVTGGQMANFTCLAAARHEVLRGAGWDVESRGLTGAPAIHVVTHADTHVTIFAALRLLGLGVPPSEGRVATDDQGRVRIDALARTLDALPPGPTIMCVQAGNVNSGAFDDIDAAADLAARRGAWLHVDGAFGLWAAAVPSLQHLVPGIARADSWAVDAHKWLNVPYDCGIAICAQPEAHRASMTATAAYLIPSDGDARDGVDWAPEFSRRGRGVTAYAALRALGREGVVEIVERTCGLARRFADRLSGHPGIRLLNAVVLNQVLVRFDAPNVSDRAAGDVRTRAIVRAVQQDGTCWMSGTDWHGQAAMRISVSNWSTTEVDVDRSVEAILRIAAKI
jgi:glutamate/tyrosine decarboxylase-like PLP-dependent enzyme